MEPQDQGMTSEPLYKRLLEDAIEEYKCDAERMYEMYHPGPVPDDIVELIAYKETLDSMLNNLNNVPRKEFTFDFSKELDRMFEERIERFEEEKSRLDDAEREGRERIEREHESSLEVANAEEQKRIEPVIEKHKELLSYHESLKDILLKYSVTPSDVTIHEDLTEEEFTALLETSLEICRNMQHSTNVRAKILYWPLEENDTRFGAYYLIFIYIVLYFFLPILAIPILCYLLYSVMSIPNKVDKLRIAESLMYNVDFSKYTHEAETLVPAVDYSDLELNIKMAREGLELGNPYKARDAEMSAFTRDIEIVEGMIQGAYDHADGHKTKAIYLINTVMEEVLGAIEDAKSKTIKFGTEMKGGLVMNHKYTLGTLGGVLYSCAEYGLRNRTFDVSDKNAMLNNIKLHIINALLSVKEVHLEIWIYDPEGLGVQFSDFLDNSFSQSIHLVNGEFSKMFEDARNYVESNIKTIGESDIDSYNKEALEIGKVTLDYRLYIIASGLKEVTETKNFSNFMEYSAKYGVLMWMLTSTHYNNCDVIPCNFVGQGMPITVDKQLINTVKETYTMACENSKVDGIDYFKVFQPKILPRDEWWTRSTEKGIDLFFGFKDGDPFKAIPMTLGDADVHALMAGATGAGKSATINQLLCSLLTAYSPNELELVMVDFKNVEFSTYSRQPDTGLLKGGIVLENIRAKELGKSIIPHATVLAGTKDGEYAVSIFKYLHSEMDRRYALFTKSGVKNIAEYRKKYPEAYMPRILVLIDEFQVMFNEVPQKIIDVIISEIIALSKLARACGGHLFFTSQSMEGTLSKDVLSQFSLRVALRCSSATSDSILGNKAASTIKSKVGFLYTNNSAGEDPSKNSLWRVPFAPTDEIMKMLEELVIMGKDPKYNSKVTDFYDQSEMYTNDKLINWYDRLPSESDSPHLLILGEQTAYTPSGSPVNFKLTVDDGENILAVAFEREDLLNLTMTFVDNIKHHGAKLLMHSADRDSHSLLDIPSIVGEEFADISTPKQNIEELLSALQEMLDARADLNPEELTPLYFIAIQWEKLSGIGKDESYRLIDKLASIVREAPIYDVHFIFVCKDVGLPNAVVSACSHRIASKCDDKVAFKYFDDSSPTKLPPVSDGHFAIYKYGSELTKFKIYQHTFTKDLESRSVVF